MRDVEWASHSGQKKVGRREGKEVLGWRECAEGVIRKEMAGRSGQEGVGRFEWA